jgi:hypothetical protein
VIGTGARIARIQEVVVGVVGNLIGRNHSGATVRSRDAVSWMHSRTVTG